MILPDGIFILFYFFLSLKHGCLGTKVNSSVRDNRGGNRIFNRIFKTLRIKILWREKDYSYACLKCIQLYTEKSAVWWKCICIVTRHIVYVTCKAFIYNFSCVMQDVA